MKHLFIVKMIQYFENFYPKRIEIEDSLVGCEEIFKKA